MKPRDVELFFSTLSSLNPTVKTELNYVNAYTLLVAVALSAQSTDRGVNKATKKLFEKVTTPQQMLDLGEKKLIEHIQTIGLYRNKARHVMQAAQRIIDVYDGKVPEAQEDLESLPGVGRKTANVIRNIIFGHPTIAVDTHIFRLSNRTGLARGKNVLEVEKKLIERVPQAYRLHAHHWLILHGRYVCRARTPLCMQCCVKELCLFDKKNQ